MSTTSIDIAITPDPMVIDYYSYILHGFILSLGQLYEETDYERMGTEIYR